MKEKIISIIAEITKIEQTELLENMDTAKLWDSMKQIEVILALEEEYGIQFEQNELAELTTTGKIVDVLQRKVG
ncbi:MAG: acyl carrier protein [Lachnospiraceae bacterium]|nr:acyl carrier protein [Lachnospiraceae bacterium]